MRILGITIPDNKQVVYGLTEVYGIGLARAGKILDAAKVAHTTPVKEITQDQENTIRKIIEDDGMELEGDLKRSVSQNIKRLKDIQCYRGGRHSRNLKVRGQRSKTNMRIVPSGINAIRRQRVTRGSGKTKLTKT